MSDEGRVRELEVRAADRRPYGRAFLALVAANLAFGAWLLWNGAVIAPHPNDLETGLPARADSWPLLRALSDYTSAFVPEMALQLGHRRKSWLATWNPHVELGKPCLNLCWFSRAYLPTRLLAPFFTDPFFLLTALTLLVVLLTGVFAFLFMRSLGLHPVACVCASLGLSMGTFCAYRLTFVMHLSPLCFALALLWHVTRFMESRSLPHALGIAFATYSLLMTGHPQFTLYEIYLVGGYALARLLTVRRSLVQTARTGAELMAAAALGFLASLPVLLDVAAAAARSDRPTRGAPWVAARVFEYLHRGGLQVLLSQLVDPFWFGNVVSSEYPFVFRGETVGPFFAGMFLLSLVDRQWRRLWPWHVYTLACLAALTCPSAFLFGQRYLGLHLSTLSPFAGAIIPVFVLAAYALDHILRTGIEQRWLAGALLIVPLLALGAAAAQNAARLDERFVAIGLVIYLGGVAVAVGRSSRLALGLTLLGLLAHSYPVALIRPRSNIHTSSPLVAELARRGADGTRYALFSDRCNVRLLPSNQEGVLGLRSIHAYDSLNPRSYQYLVRQILIHGTHSRGFRGLDDEKMLEHPALALSGVGTIVSCRRLASDALRQVPRFRGFYLYAAPSAPVLQRQTTGFGWKSPHDVSMTEGVEGPELPVDREVDLDDFLRFRLTASRSVSLLFVSQQHHPFWQARAGELPLATVVVDGFFLGVLVPPGVERVDLEFRAWALWSDLPQALFACLGLGVLGHEVLAACRRRRFRAAPGHGSAVRG